MTLAVIEDSLVSSSIAVDIRSKVTILDAIHFLTMDWSLVKM